MRKNVRSRNETYMLTGWALPIGILRKQLSFVLRTFLRILSFLFDLPWIPIVIVTIGYGETSWSRLGRVLPHSEKGPFTFKIIINVQWMHGVYYYYTILRNHELCQVWWLHRVWLMLVFFWFYGLAFHWAGRRAAHCWAWYHLSTIIYFLLPTFQNLICICV